MVTDSNFHFASKLGHVPGSVPCPRSLVRIGDDYIIYLYLILSVCNKLYSVNVGDKLKVNIRIGRASDHSGVSNTDWAGVVDNETKPCV